MPAKQFRTWLLTLPRWAKSVLLIGNDFFLLALALWLAYTLRLNTLYVPLDLEAASLFAAAPIIGVATFYFRGLYRLVTRYIAQEAAGRIYVTVALAVLFWVLLILMLGVSGVPRSVVVIYGLIAAAFIRLSRYYAGWVLQALPHATPAKLDPRTKVAIYGAGDSGTQLRQALSGSTNYKPVAFIDDDPSLWGQNIANNKVYQPDKIPKLIERDGVREIFLALPSASRHERKAVIHSLETLPVVVKTLPALEDIASGKVQVSDLRPVDVDDLLGRDPVPPVPKLLDQDIRNKSVLITGAGGSIGSELARQVLRSKPKSLVLLDLSETALYQIELEIAELRQQLRDETKKAGKRWRDIKVFAVLGSVLDDRLIRHVISLYDVKTIYHAAAYKHVPLVEINQLAGLHNNTLGTLALAEAANELGVERFVLISTDKAVRPTNVMGASKRLAELVLQALAAEPDTETMFTMVRFGNVLDSSGSVVRRFRRQIEEGGPVTVTHRDILRYFMSIPEAAELVIQAGAMADGGDVFVLDMGKPVKIDDLARTMIRLSGLDVQDDDNPTGDIAIDYVGLRKGEKLYEELLIGENTTGTQHSRIMKNIEPLVPLASLRVELDRLRLAIESQDLEAVEPMLKSTVEGYRQGGALHDVPGGEFEDWTGTPRTIH
jgi:FlaA1/EpsC-like NDP-sugar epimerase